MKLVFIRHAEPDYQNNTLTEKGFLEAKALGLYLKNMNFTSIYSSPYNRAYYTALEIMKYHQDKELIVKDWLHEFDYPILKPLDSVPNVSWDFYPRYYTNDKAFYDKDKYLTLDYLSQAKIKEKYDEVIKSFDDLLEENGYIRKNNMYTTDLGNHKTLVFVAHFGLISVLMSHLMNIPYLVLSSTMVMLPTGVTIFTSEERLKGEVVFRCNRYGELSHLKEANIEPSFHARFCETFEDKNRH